MNQRVIAVLLTAALTCSLFFAGPIAAQAAITGDTEDFHTESFSTDDTSSDNSYEEGQVIVTIAAPHDTPLTQEGAVSFDEEMEVEQSLDFGTADVLAKTSEQADFLDDKTLYVVCVSSDEYSTKELIERLDNQAYVVSAEPDYYVKKMVVTNDTYSSYQWALGDSDSFSQTKATGIHYSGYSQKSSTSPVVAIVDTGVDYTHPDLAGHMWKNNTSLDGTYGYDFGDNDSDPMDEDEDGHGTHCAGTIGAISNNKLGIAGVASNVKIMALKVFNAAGNATTSNVTSAFNYIYQAQQLGVNIAAINCSFGGNPSTSTLATLIKKIGQKGALFVFAAGNDGQSHDGDTSICPYDLNSPYTVIVGSSTPEDTKSSFSDYGSKSVDLLAPGEKILSTINSNYFLPSVYSQAEREKLTSYYTEFNSSEPLLLTSADIDVDLVNEVSYIRVTHSDIDYFNKGTGSQCVSFTGGRNSQFAVYIDVTSLDLDIRERYIVSFNWGIPSDGEVSWEQDAVQRIASGENIFVTKGGHTYLLVRGLSGNLSSVSTIYFDNLGISKANPDESAFGKYNLIDGTSMAAPFVTGAIAVLAGTYPSDTSIQRRERLMTCVRKVSALSGTCKSGGILDLSKVPSATYTTKTVSKIKVTKVKLNKKKATIHYKKKKKCKLKATVTPKTATNKKVKWYVSNKKYASVTQKGVVKAKKKGIGHTIKVYAKAKDGSKKKAYCKIKIKK